MLDLALREKNLFEVFRVRFRKFIKQVEPERRFWKKLNTEPLEERELVCQKMEMESCYQMRSFYSFKKNVSHLMVLLSPFPIFMTPEVQLKR